MNEIFVTTFGVGSTEVFKVNGIFFCFVLRYSLKNTRTASSTSEKLVNQNQLRLAHTCSITSSFDWFTGLDASFLIGQDNYFAFGFSTLN